MTVNLIFKYTGEYQLDLKQCMLCPRKCAVDRTAGKVGFCKMDSKIKVARAALHFWEEPCISGTKGSGTVFFSGCNLRCVFCQNYKISTLLSGKIITESELGNIFLDLESQGAHNINLVTPTHFIPQIINALTMAKKKGLSIPTVYNCGGYESVDALKMLDGMIDIYLPDFKYFDNRFAKEYSSVSDYRECVQKAIDEMVRQVGKPVFDADGIMKKGVIVRHLLLPGLLFDSKKIIDYLYRTYGDDIWISIMNQYTPLEWVKDIQRLNRRVSEGCYNALIDYAAELGVENAYIQEGGTAKESFIPDFF